MKILFLSRWLPYPTNNGSKIRVLNLLTSLAERHQVSLLTFGQNLGTDPDEHSVTELCHRVQVVPYREFRPASPKALAGFLSLEPRSLVDTFQPPMRAAVVEEVKASPPDVIVASQLDMVPYTLAVPRVPALLEELELTMFRERWCRGRNLRIRCRAGLTWLKLVAYLRRVIPRFDACTVASELERENLRRAVPGYSRVHVVPNAIDLSRYSGHFGNPRPNTLVYAGALTYTANFDAVAHFVRDILPLVICAEPEVRFRVTGNTHGLETAPGMYSQSVEYTGYVDDVRPVVAQSWASTVPLRQGGGTRLKILEAMALGTPVVSTSKGAEGLRVRDGDHLLLADDSETFASRVVDLLRSPELHARLAAGGRSLVASTYNARAAGASLCELVEQVARTGGRG
jgi:glycosyltransferase involved in cell wall biosynthesis